MQAYESQQRPGVLDSSELDPCIAAETRLKKSVISSRKKRTLFILGVVILLIVLLTVLLIYLITTPTPREEVEVLYEDVVAEEEEPWKMEEELLPNSAFVPVPSHVKSSEPSLNPYLKGAKVTEVTEATRKQSIASTVEEAHKSEPVPVQTSTYSVLQTTTRPLRTTTQASTTSTTSSKLPSTKTTTMMVEEEAPLHYLRQSEEVEKDCSEHLRAGRYKSGIYRISPEDASEAAAFDIFCDMVTLGGGWTVLQRRSDNSEPFYNRSWSEYEEGFGRLDRSHWLGLEKVQRLASDVAGLQTTLRIELQGDHCNVPRKCSGQQDGFWWGEWDFGLGDASSDYRLALSPINAGNLSTPAKDYFYQMNNGRKFTTVDVDNDSEPNWNCASFRNFGAWWHHDCSLVTLNGMYGDTWPKLRYQVWYYHADQSSISYHIHPKQSIMMIRPKVN